MINSSATRIYSTRDPGGKTDDQLMRSYAKGNMNAFEILYGRYKTRLFSYMARNCHDRDRVEELYQDVWLRVITSASRYKAEGRFRSWLFTLAHNRLVDFYKSGDNRIIREELDEGTAAGAGMPSDESRCPVEKALESEEMLAKIEILVNRLPLEQKMAFILREDSGFAISEIAEIQGISYEAAKSRLRYAYQKLREGLESNPANGDK